MTNVALQRLTVRRPFYAAIHNNQAIIPVFFITFTFRIILSRNVTLKLVYCASVHNHMLIVKIKKRGNVADEDGGVN